MERSPSTTRHSEGDRLIKVRKNLIAAQNAIKEAPFRLKDSIIVSIEKLDRMSDGMKAPIPTMRKLSAQELISRCPRQELVQHVLSDESASNKLYDLH